MNRANDSIVKALDRDPEDPLILGNQAYVAFLLGQTERARELLTIALTLGGENIREAELKDADINRLPGDDDFCSMVRSIPANPQRKATSTT